jgi:RHS repeat-associated protein
MPQLSEKPHQGFATKKTALHPASSVPNFRVTLGLRAVVVENGVREIYSARYYNPATGRFLSRDPEDGKPRLPATLHKYLYVGGDPVDGVDPTGRATYTNPANQTFGGALTEYAGLALDSLNRATFFVQSTLPEWLGTVEGKIAVGEALLALGAVEQIVCEVEPGCSPTPSLPNGAPGTGAAYPVIPFTPGQVTGQDLTDTLDRPF